MTDTTNTPTPADDVIVNTEFGPVAVSPRVLSLWNFGGWPTDDVLRRMAAEFAAAGGGA